MTDFEWRETIDQDGELHRNLYADGALVGRVVPHGSDTWRAEMCQPFKGGLLWRALAGGRTARTWRSPERAMKHAELAASMSNE